MRALLIVGFLLVWVTTAIGQTGPIAVSQPGYVAAVVGADCGGAGGLGDPINGTCISSRFGIPLNYFATKADLAGLATPTAVLQDIRRSAELAVIAAALKDAIPNAGDTFAISINGAAGGDVFAGAIGLGLNVSDFARLNLNYGQAASTSMVTGGVTLSFP